MESENFGHGSLSRFQVARRLRTAGICVFFNRPRSASRHPVIRQDRFDMTPHFTYMVSMGRVLWQAQDVDRGNNLIYSLLPGDIKDKDKSQEFYSFVERNNLTVEYVHASGHGLNQGYSFGWIKNVARASCPCNVLSIRELATRARCPCHLGRHVIEPCRLR